MSNIAIVTDSNSGITQAMAQELGIFVVPMPFYINGELYLEDINLTHTQFYEKLMDDNAEISTSQPSPGDVMDLWDEILKDHDSIVYIPMSSGLSGSCQSAMMLAEDYDGKVQVVDNLRISVTLLQSVEEAKMLAEAGKSALEIKELLEEHCAESCIYLAPGTLEYLKKGGRITSAAAAIGSVLKITPVLQLLGGKVDAFKKCRGMKSAKNTILKAIQDSIDSKFAGLDPIKDLKIGVVYGNNYEDAKVWKEEVLAAFPGIECYEASMSLSVACHVGPEVLAATVTKKLEIK